MNNFEVITTDFNALLLKYSTGVSQYAGFSVLTSCFFFSRNALNECPPTLACDPCGWQLIA